MPTYEYACRGCGEHLEVVQSFKDDPLETCSLCGGQLRKVFSAAGIIFKGSGYYVTDSRDGKKKSAAASSGTGAAASASGDTSSSDSGSSDAKSSSSESAKKSDASSTGGSAAESKSA